MFPSLTMVCLSVLASMLVAAVAQAEQSEPSAEPINKLNTVLVIGKEDISRRIDSASAEGRYYFDRDAIEQHGSANGQMTELLETVPNVQFGDEADSADALFDLKPKSVSISGGRFYDNNFSVNGLSNGSLLDPAGASTRDDSLSDVPGHEQAIFLDIDQLESLTVYDSNVPAHYGGFTGGVVDAAIRKPGREPASKLKYFTTRSAWVDYSFIDNSDPANPFSNSLLDDPEFERHRASLSHEQAISDHGAVRLGVNASLSTTPIISLRRVEKTRSSNYNFSFTHAYLSDSLWDLTSYLSYSPYEKDTLLKNTKDSAYTISGGGLLASADLEWFANDTEHRLTLALNHSENSREAKSIYRKWKNTPSAQWGRIAGLANSREGGYGNIDKQQTRVMAKWLAEQSSFDTWYHGLNYGAELKQSYSSFERLNDAYTYSDAEINTQIQCLGQSVDCLQGEQYFRSRKIYAQNKARVSLSELSSFAELTWIVSNFDVSAGARLDYDNFTRDLNIGWRSRGSFRVWGDDSLIVSAGYNRYYGGSLLTYKLREAIQPYYEEYRGRTMNVVNPWQLDTSKGSTRYRHSDVKTPFSDELSLELKAAFWGGIGRFKILTRDNDDELVRTKSAVQPDGYAYYSLDNSGDTQYRGLSFDWDRDMDGWNFGVNITHSETKSSHASYDDTIDHDGNNEDVWYQGRREKRGDITRLRENFARPIVANLYLYLPFTERFSARFTSRYKGSYTTITATNKLHLAAIIDNDDGSSSAELLDVYEDKYRRASVFFDATFKWQPFASDLSLHLEAKNLFNSRTYTIDDDESGIEVGRSIWLGVEAGF